jgi:selenophosphate synthetase-related protein
MKVVSSLFVATAGVVCCKSRSQLAVGMPAVGCPQQADIDHWYGEIMSTDISTSMMLS